MYYSWNDGTSLYHHGILGQKWGVQNGPPYPLDDKDHNASEKKAGWKKSLSGSDESRVTRKKNEYKAQLDDLRQNGINSKTFKKAYYYGSDDMSNSAFVVTYGMSKKEALNAYTNAVDRKYTRASYKEKLKNKQPLTGKEQAQLNLDRFRTVMIVAAATGTTLLVAQKMGIFESQFSTSTLRHIEKESLFSESTKAISAAGDMTAADIYPLATGGIKEMTVGEGYDEHVFSTGTQFHRITGYSVEDYSEKSRLYVSVTESDRDIYKAFLKDHHGTGQRFEHTLEAIRDIKVAGTNKQKEILLKSLEDDDFFETFSEFAASRSMSPSYLKAQLSQLRGIDPKKIVEKYYTDVVYQIVKRDSSIGKAYVDKILSSGFDAAIDDFDRATGSTTSGMSYYPLILLNPDQLIKAIDSKKVSYSDEHRAKERTIRAGIYDALLQQMPSLPDRGK